MSETDQLKQDDDTDVMRVKTVNNIDEGKKIVVMKKGDYSVHVLVEEVKSLDEIVEGQVPYPIVKITCFNSSKRTEKPATKTFSCTYDEHFYFDKANLSVEELDSSKIQIEVFDSSNSSKKKDYYGIYEFDLEHIYSQNHHSLKNYWLALSNPESSDMTKIRGYLKLSISVLHDYDPRVELKSNPDSTNYFIPSQIKMEYKQLSIYLIRGEEFPDMDSTFSKSKKNRECDPYVEFHYMGSKISSSHKKNVNDKTEWNEIINMAVPVPAVSRKIVCLVKDYDFGTSDDSIGSYEIDVNDVIGNENKYANYKYIDIYGSSKNSDDKYSKLMNTNAEIGSAWNGRILLKIECKKTDTPIKNVLNLTDENELKIARSVNRSECWNLKAKVYFADFLPSNNKYSLKITFQENSTIFEKKEPINKCIQWKNVKDVILNSISSDPEDLPDVFFYLLNKNDEPVSFQRIKAKKFYLNEKIMIIKLFPDACYGNKDNIYSGLLKVKITLYNLKEKGQIDLQKFKEGDSDEDEEEDLEKLQNKNAIGIIGDTLKPVYKIVCVVYMTRYLVSGDENSKNDPYVCIKCDSERTTSIKHDTVNGIWNETLIFENIEMDLKRKSTWPIILATVKDNDLIGEDILGYTYVWLNNSPVKINDVSLMKPKWHQLFLPNSNEPQGELLLAFYIFDSDHYNLSHQINPIPETVPYTCEINILGLRDIKPLAMLPIKKAFIKFDMNSLNVTGKKEDTLESKKTQPKDKGSNPTINSVMKFDIKLPKEDVFMPLLQCEVFDYLLSGLFNKSLGVFLLNMRRLIRITEKQIKEDMDKTKKKIDIYLDKGEVTNNIGAMQELTNLMNKEEEEANKEEEDVIDTNQNNIIVDNNKQEVLCNAFRESVKKVKTKNYNATDIEENKNKSSYFVLLPQFKSYSIPGTKKGDEAPYKIEDENLAPSSDYYFPIGYIPKPSENKELNKDGELVDKDLEKPCNIKKHYRRIFKQELEKCRELNIKSPFTTEELLRGKDEDESDEKALFDSLTKDTNKILKEYDPKDDNKTFEEKLAIKEKKEKKLRGKKTGRRKLNDPKNMTSNNYGKFKALIRVCQKEKMDEYRKVIEKFKANEEITKELKNEEKYDLLTRSILVKHEVIIRVYILELKDLAQKDLLSKSDPYIKIYFGDKLKFDEQKYYHDNETNVKWYKYYDILTEFPGESTLNIEVWDYNPIFKDELIGLTKIDLEDRYFDYEWQNLEFKPIETRSLINPDFSNQQGNISLWIEIFDKKDSINMQPWQIQPEPITELELRLIVWETEDMRMMDDEGTSDIYIVAFVDPKNKQSTDTHYRCTTGNASFNWRIVLDLKVPSNYNKLCLYAYDKDIFSKDDFISMGEINISDVIKIPKNLDVPISLNQSYVKNVNDNEKTKYENLEFISEGGEKDRTKFWVQCYQNNNKSGRILCSLDILPKWRADLNKVGLGRNEPNVSPYLAPPVGRFQWSWNPITLLNQCVGPRFRKKMYCWMCVICLIVYFACLIPYMVYHLTGQLLNPFNYIKK